MFFVFLFNFAVVDFQFRLICASCCQAELIEAVRKRRVRENNASDDEEDLGLPRSPVSNSPTTADEMFTKVSSPDLPYFRS